MNYQQNQSFSNLDFSGKTPESNEYENCIFNGCNFSESDLSQIKYIECEFNDCNLSNAILNKTSFQDVTMNNCKLLGLHFENCNGFNIEIRFNKCQLDFSSFFGMKLKHSKFDSCKMNGVDFTECDLNYGFVQRCDLLNALFDNTLLEKADLRYSINYSIDPENNYIKGAKVSSPAVFGFLDKYELSIDD